jgi:hypothetical protein
MEASGANPFGFALARLVLACVVATFAFWAYTQTLLPGVDLGDTGGFQAAVLWPEVSARQAYPLYYDVARPFIQAVSRANPARGLNLFSAIWAAVVVGLVAWLSASLTGSLAAGAVSGLLLAFSYTFWTQAIIAEVYSLHLALVLFCMIALYAYAARPTRRRLAMFFAVYALSFGNHLSMILWLIPFAVFIVMTSPDRRVLVRPPVMILAVGFAVAGALQYWPNFISVAHAPHAPEGWIDRAAAFWFDTTKADWRESFVLGVPRTEVADRIAMWWFDLRQQFGLIGIALACVGAIALVWRARPWGVLVLAAYVLSTTFALTYNVGDTHVFLLPGHLLVALCAGAALWADLKVGPYTRAARALRRSVAVLALLSCGWRGWTTWPAVDRHEDRRGEQLIADLARNVSDRDAILVEEMNWQLENVLWYVARYERPDLPWARLGDVLPHLPFLIEDNHEIGRDVVLTAEAAAAIVSMYGPRFPIVADGGGSGLSDVVARIPAGSPYVFSLLTPARDDHLDGDAVAADLDTLTGGHVPPRRGLAYELIAGLSGEAPLVSRESDRPFEQRFAIAGDRFVARMDSWLPVDTFRRAGFGQVIRGREHVLILERGANLVWFDRDGVASRPQYAGSLYAPRPRWRIPAAAPQLAHATDLFGAKLEGH